MTAAVLAAGILIGTFYTLSPVAAWFAVWMAAVVLWAARGATGRERYWIVGALTAAIAIRVAAIAILPFTIDPAQHNFTAYFGDATYAIQRSIWIRNVYLGVPIAARDFFEAFEPVFGYSGYHYVLAYVQVLLGPSPYGLALVSTGVFITAAVLLYRRSRSAFGPVAAFVGLAALIFLPTWIAWSVAPLKEPMQFLLLAIAVESVIVLARGRTAARIVAAGGVVVALVVSATLRNGAEAIITAGLGCGLLAYVATRRWWVAALLTVLLPLVAWRAVEYPPVRQRAGVVVLDAVNRHRGHTFSSGAYYRLLEERFYQVRDFNEPVYIHQDEAIRFLARAPIALLAEPLPWALDSPKWVAAVPQQVVWYALLLLAAFGAAAGGRRDPLLTALCVGMIVAAVAIIAPNSGNVGTAMRHRDMFAPFVAVLAGAGLQAIANRVARAGEMAI